MSAELEVDLVVLGGGMAGMSAAAAASRDGRTVLVLERAPEIGGSAALSEGYVWTAPTLEVLVEEDPEIDRELGRILVESLEEALEWVASLGVAVGDPLTGVLGFGVGRQIDIHAFLSACRAAIEANGGWIVANAHPRELVVEDGRVVGVTVEEDGQAAAVAAPWTLLATGGFQANSELVRQHIRESWDPILLRASPHSFGGGYELARQAGAAFGSMSGFYGHLMPSPLDRPLTRTDFTALAQYHSDHGVLLNHAGHRFTDESLGDHVNTEHVANADGERAVLVCDEWIRQELVLKAFIPGMDQGLDKFQLAAGAGARLASADSIEAVAAAVAQWGYDGHEFARTLTEFNRLVRDDTDALAIPRRRLRRPLSVPPFVAVEVQPAITFTYGGVRTDAAARVLDPSGGPIHGLLAAGADAALFVHGYAGGLSRALIFGLRAARTAVAAAAT